MRLARVLVPAVLALLAVLVSGCASTPATTGPARPNGIVQEEVDRRVGEIRFLHGRELLDNLVALVHMGDLAVPTLLEATKSKDWLTRSSVAWVFGAMGDRRNIPGLRALLEDPVAEVRYQSAASLVDLGDGAGFQVLVHGLADGDLHNRYKCFEALKRATGQHFGYAHDDAPGVRRVAVARWLDWLDGVRASAL